MKTKDKANRKKPTAFLAGSILSLWLVTSPLAGISGPEKDGGCNADDKWMTRPVEATAADYESDLMVEDWMTRPFDVADAVYESDLMLEDWMTRPFDVADAVYESDLMLEDWMTRPFDVVDALFEPDLMVEDWMTRPFNRPGSEYRAGWTLR
jgi:alpha-L-fucosidase